MASPHAESFYCITEKNLDLDYRRIYTGTCIGCAAVGLAGSLTQVISLRKLWNYSPGSTSRNPFTPNTSVIFFLAVADMLACLAVIARSVMLAIIDPPTVDEQGQAFPASTLVVNIGAPVQSFLQFLFLATYFWTFFFAFDIYLQLSKRTCPNFSYHVFTWLAAAILTGFSEFIVFFDVGFPCASGLRVTLAHMATYIPIAFVMLANPLIYVLSYSKLKTLLRRQGVYGHTQHKLMTHVTRKFAAYVVIFWICWLPSIATGLYLQVVGVDERFPFSLWMLTAILNPLQGFFNCFIYGIGQEMVGSMQIADRQVRQRAGNRSGPNSSSQHPRGLPNSSSTRPTASASASQIGVSCYSPTATAAASTSSLPFHHVGDSVSEKSPLLESALTSASSASY